jgi:hypothetical protein
VSASPGHMKGEKDSIRLYNEHLILRTLSKRYDMYEILAVPYYTSQHDLEDSILMDLLTQIIRLWGLYRLTFSRFVPRG